MKQILSINFIQVNVCLILLFRKFLMYSEGNIYSQIYKIISRYNDTRWGIHSKKIVVCKRDVKKK